MSSKIIKALSGLGLLEKYQQKFEENNVDDSVIEAWFMESSFDDLKTIISTVGHRMKFIMAFKNLPTIRTNSTTLTDCVETSSSTQQLENESNSSLVNENVPVEIEEAVASISLGEEDNDPGNILLSIQPPPTEMLNNLTVSSESTNSVTSIEDPSQISQPAKGKNVPLESSPTAATQMKNKNKKPTPSFQLPAVPEPIQIIEYQEVPQDDKTTQESSLELVFYKERLQAILNKVGQRQISILSIAGPSRKGKSFILGFMLRYLKSIQKSNENADDDDFTSDWMGWKRPDEPLTGFSWRNGYERETSGILMWSEPFNVTSCDGREFSIILMDTQGVFDEHTSQREWSTIVGLSLLTSSCLIFNIFNDLQEDVLQSLENFMAFGLLAVGRETSESENNSTDKPFQRLTFLIRDWNIPDEFPYGEKGGKKFLDRKLEIKAHHRKDHKRIRQQLPQCFDQLDCFLMPEPGENAKKSNYSGCLSGLDLKFAKSIENFISRLFNIDEFPTKSIGGNFVTGVELFTYFENYVEIFKSEETPQPKSLFEVTKSAFFSSLINKTFALYSSEITKKFKTKRFFSNHELQLIQNAAVDKAMKFFEKSRTMGSLEESQLNREKLEEKIRDHFQRIQEKNLKVKKTVADEAVKDSIKKFNETIQMRLENANIDPGDCFDEETIINFTTSAKKSSLQHFFDALSIEEGSKENKHEFQEQQLELESAIEKLSEETKQHNQLRCSNSERILRDEFEELVKNYKDKMNRRIENKFIPDKQLESILESAKNETLKSFQPRSQFTLYKLFKEKLIQQIVSEQDEITKISIKERAKIILEIEKKSSELSNQCREKLSQVKGIDLEMVNKEFESLRENNIQELDNFLQIYFVCDNENKSEDETTATNLETLGESTQLKKQYTDKLLSGMEESFKEIKSQFALRLESLIKSISEKESESLKFYAAAMDNVLKANPTCSQDLLKSIHSREKASAESLLFAALNEILQAVKSTKDSEKKEENSPDEMSDFITRKINKTQKNFEEKCEIQFQDYKDRCKLQREYQESKAKNNVSAVEKFYSTELKEIADHARTQEEFDKREKKINSETKEQLKTKLDKNLSLLLKKEFIRKLEDSMKNHYEETLEYLQMKLEEDKVAVEGAFNSARNYYQSEMEKHLSSPSFIHPKDLKNLSDKAVNAAVDQCKKTAALTSGQVQQLAEKVASCFRKFKDENSMKASTDGLAIGIDLGTTYCCVAVYLNGNVKIIPNTEGKNTTPSYISFAPDGSWCIGRPAKDKAHIDPKNTIFDAKRLIGRKFDDSDVQKDIKLWPFEVVNEKRVVKIKAQDNSYYPEQISSFLLAYLKECAEKYLGVEIKKAVITVPAYFKDGQKEATKHAGELAGLEVLKIINEPTAAAMAYKLDYADESHRNVLIFDLGGGTFDVALVSISGGNLEVKALDGDTHLGGEDFDNEMVLFCIDFFKAQTGIDLTNQTRTLDPEIIYRTVMRMRRMCEGNKINLSSTKKETVEADVIVPGHDLSVPITRQQFEEMNRKHFDKCLEIVEKVLKDAGLEKSQIDDIVMVGGSTRIPKIQEMLSLFFGGKALNHRVNPDEAVAVGAAMQASLLNAKQGDHLKKIISSISDVTPHSIGKTVRGTEDGVTYSIIIPKNSKIPCRKVKGYQTAHDDQTVVDIGIYEGERAIAEENHKLGKFKLTGIPPAKAGVEKHDVVMEINEDGLLTVTATSLSTGSTANISVEYEKGRLNKESIQQLRDATADKMKQRRKYPTASSDLTLDD